MTLVWKTAVGPANHRLVLLALADAANDEGVCWPSVATIARKAGCGEATVRRALSQLESEGLVSREKRGVNGRQRSNFYHLQRAALEALIEGSQFEPPQIEPSQSGGRGVSNMKVEGSQTGTQNPKLEPSEETKPAPQGSDAAPDAEPEFSAKDVVAAYVDSFRLKSGGQDPVGRFIGQVGREAKKLISEGRSSELLLRAADQLGKTPYASLENQVARLMTNTPAGVQTGRTEAYQPGLDSRRNEENWQRLYAEDPSRFSVADPSLDDDEPAF